jgi:hypothetical protein
MESPADLPGFFRFGVRTAAKVSGYKALAVYPFFTFTRKMALQSSN